MKKPNKNKEFKPKQSKGIVVEGTVTEALPNAMFRVQLDNDAEVLTTISGKIRIHFVRVLPDDRVQIELSPYDLTRGRIIYVYKQAKKQ